MQTEGEMGDETGSFEQVGYEASDGIATLTLDRPERMNAFTGQMSRELIAALDRADDDDDVRAVIVTGRGRAFCAGADLSGGRETFASGGSGVIDSSGVRRDGGGMVALRMFALRKPIIAAVNGAAVGIGVTMTLPMDIRLASTDARFGFVFNRRGIVPEAASSWFLPRIVGISQALEWTFSGRVFEAAEALTGGLVRSVHEPDDLLPAARNLALQITSESAPVSVALTRMMFWRMLGASHPMEAHRVDSRALQARGKSADAHEGVTSFLERRAASFVDRVSGDLPDVFPQWVEPTFS
jgi:enoyl-CoA hydratase/carnithine racemase